MLKILKLDNKKSLKILKLFLDKRRSIQKDQTKIVSKIIKNVKKDGDKAVLNYEKKFSKIKTKSNKLQLSIKEINKWWAVLVTLQLPLQCQCSTLLLS